MLHEPDVKDYPQLLKDLELDEGCVLFPYKDTVDKTTIGIGRNLDDRGITKDEAKFLLLNDVNECLADARSIFGAFDTFPARAQHVIIGCIFNLGAAGFRKFRRTIALMEAGDWDAASEELLDSKAARQLPNRYERYAQKLRLCA